MKKLIILFVLPLLNFLILNAQSSKKSRKDFIVEKASIAGVTKGEIDRSLILDSKELSFDKEDALKYKIISFKMTLVIKGSDANLRFFENNSNGKLSSSMLEAINKAPAGSKVFFEDVRCVDKNKITHQVEPVDLIIK